MRENGSHFINNGSLYYAPFVYNGYIFKYSFTDTTAQKIKLDKKVKGFIYKKPFEKFEGRKLDEADVSGNLGGQEVQFLVHNLSKGLFKLDTKDGQIVHFTSVENSSGTKRTFGVEIYDKNMTPVGYAPLKTIDMSEQRMFKVNVKWKDAKDRFYIVDRNNRPTIKIVKLNFEN